MTRLQLLHKGPFKEDQLQLGLASIYQYSNLLNIDYIPKMTPEVHTMYDALDIYVQQKLPTKDILKIIQNHGALEVHGIYPKHFELIYKNELASGKIKEIEFYHRPTTRKYNVVRPRFFINRIQNKFMMCVAPGSDYIKHYGTIIRHLCTSANHHSELRLYYYPMAFHTIPFWTHLYRGFVEEGDRVIIGYVDEVYNEINAELNLTPISHASNPYLESRRFQLPSGSIINFLGVNFSFWGNLSQVIAESICSSGATEIIYAGKLGSLTNPESLYRDLFIPTEYFTLSHKNIVNHVANLKNGLVAMYPHLNSGVHVSVPTVLEEDYTQRKVADELKAQSIDNEISQIAHSISNFNIANGSDVSYSSFHFATDYVRSYNERLIKTPHDLSNNRSLSALNNKNRVIKNCAKHLIAYLDQT